MDETWKCGEYSGAIFHSSGGNTTEAWKAWGMGWEGKGWEEMGWEETALRKIHCP